MTIPRRDPAPLRDSPMGVDDRPAFLTTHRAIGVCTREFALLVKELIGAVTTLATHAAHGKPVIRQSPDRVVLQVGEVALTVTWLRNGSDFPQHGQLLGIIWRGVIAPRGEYSTERMNTRRVAVAPIAEWEESLMASAENAESWRWCSDADRHGVSSAQLAARLVERMRLSYPADDLALTAVAS